MADNRKLEENQKRKLKKKESFVRIAQNLLKKGKKEEKIEKKNESTLDNEEYSNKPPKIEAKSRRSSSRLFDSFRRLSFYSKAEKEEETTKEMTREERETEVRETFKLLKEKISASFKIESNGDMDLSLLKANEWKAIIAMEDKKTSKENYFYINDYARFVKGELTGQQLYKTYIIEGQEDSLNIDKSVRNLYVEKLNKGELTSSFEKDFFKQVASNVIDLIKLNFEDIVSITTEIKEEVLLKAGLLSPVKIIERPQLGQ